ncbi:MAG: hypothetical protein JW999_06010 [Methanotrichaceae archaeon]|nr:hypothetical protein [Methanotrichaceae archaeon]
MTKEEISLQSPAFRSLRLPAAAPGSRRAALCAARVPAARVRLGRPGLRGCRQGGGIAWQALVSGGRSPVGPEETEPFLLKEVIVQ